jgi:hypothetical protein
MSNTLAIAAVTATLQHMLSDGITAGLPAATITAFNLGNTHVTTKPPDRARSPGDNFNQLNLFLYQATPDGALRNMDMPRQVGPGESGPPPVALTLHYLVTAIGQNDDDTRAHILLGQAIRIFHDRPVLSPAEIKDALADNDLYAQVERVRITPQPLSLEELSKLWATFQTQYRISAAYQVSAILIESGRPARAPLPVLMRGPGDIGPQIEPGLNFPIVEELALPERERTAQLGDTLILRGQHLLGAQVELRLTHARLDEPKVLPVSAGAASATEIRVALPDDAASWPAGLYTLAVVSAPADPQGPRRVSNELPLALAPQVMTGLPAKLRRNAKHKAVLTLTCRPQVWPEQRAALLLGDREILARPRSTQTDSLTFDIVEAPLGEHVVRLRVDGVDSRIVDMVVSPSTGKQIPVFKASQKVTIV